MKQGDIIKLGRVVLKVKRCNIKNGKYNEAVKESLIQCESNAGIGELCKICHTEEDTIRNPLLSICHCTGSMRFVHYNCLKIWLNYKLTIKKQEHLNSYTWKSFACEICKAPYHSSIMHGGIEYTLADIPLPFADSYIVLETSTKGKFHSKSIHVLIPNETKSVFKIGRGHESDIKVADISVSRTHAKISMTEEGFALEDYRSRFGTLLLLNNEPKEIDADDGLTVQVGRTIITFSLGQKDCIGLRGVDIQNIEQTRTYRREISNT